MKIFTIADIHIGKRNDIKNYFENELINIINIINEKRPDLIVICGDLFDKRILMNSQFAQYANILINSIADYANTYNKKFYLLKGTLSHDFNQLNSYVYLTNSNIKIINTVTEEYLDNMNILFIPEEYEDSKEDYYKDTVFNSDKKYDFVFGHGMFNFAGGYATESGKNNHIVFTVEDFSNNVYGSVIFGHIHIRMKNKNCQYVGSYSRYNFGEEGPKGSLFIEYDEFNKNITKEEFIENTNAPKYDTINATMLGEETVFEDIKKYIKSDNDRLRIIIDSDISETKFQNLKAISIENDRIVIYKRMRGLSKEEDDVKSKEIEEKRKKRKELLEKYSKMNFIDITKSVIKDKYNVTVTTEEINESLL